MLFRSAAVESENFRKLLLSFAEDIRVIIIMIADRLCVMKMINHHPNEKYRYDIACEASYLYAPLAHRLGLYSIKSELEDLSLKYTNREIYDQIAHKLNETKRNRDKYIMEFIQYSVTDHNNIIAVIEFLCRAVIIDLF